MRHVVGVFHGEQIGVRLEVLELSEPVMLRCHAHRVGGELSVAHVMEQGLVTRRLGRHLCVRHELAARVGREHDERTAIIALSVDAIESLPGYVQPKLA